MSYIEREKALKVVADIMSDCKVSHKHRALNRNIKQIPTADVVEVRHGHWKYLWLDAVCSECGYINEADVVTRCRSDPPYCPKCGAKMDGERSENDND